MLRLARVFVHEEHMACKRPERYLAGSEHDWDLELMGYEKSLEPADLDGRHYSFLLEESVLQAMARRMVARMVH